MCEGGLKLPKRNSTTCSILERSVNEFVVIIFKSYFDTTLQLNYGHCSDGDGGDDGFDDSDGDGDDGFDDGDGDDGFDDSDGGVLIIVIVMVLMIVMMMVLMIVMMMVLMIVMVMMMVLMIVIVMVERELEKKKWIINLNDIFTFLDCQIND